MLLSQAIDALLLATKAEGRSPETVITYERRLKPLIEFLGDVPIDEITAHDLRRYVAGLWDCSILYSDHPTHERRKGSLSPSTINGRVRAFKRLFNWLEEEEVIQDNPTRRIKTPRPKQGEPKSIDTEDIVALLATTEGESVTDLRDRAIIFFLTDTGCRVGGLCHLHVQDLNFEEGLAKVCEKGSKTRMVPFTPMTAEMLNAWLEVRPQDQGDWVFVSLGTKSKGRFKRNGVAHMLKRRAKRAGVTGRVNPHAFRHAFARHFLLSGGDLGTLSALMGHEGTEVTTRYYGIFTIQELKAKHAKHNLVAGIFGGDRNGDQ
jgi:site-specific recombinase XerD